MKDKIQILVKYNDFILYKEKYKTDKLCESSVIWASSKSKLISNIFKTNEELFDGLETKYQIINTDKNYLIIFKSISNTEYRFDLFKDPSNDIYHLGFGLKDTSEKEYEEITNKHESIDVFNRLIWVLNDVTDNIGINKFIIGITENEKKNRIYQYMLRHISGWEKIDSSYYVSGKAIYFEL